MTDATAALRKQRERDYHDARYADETRLRARKYYEVDGGRERYRELVSARVPGSTVLEYGCGTGSLAFDLAAAGAEVVGIDISATAIEAARAAADRIGSQARFVEMDAEALRFEDDSFDLICGTGILHHLDLGVALPEIARVLRPSGRAVFLEPLGHNPVINAYRRMTPTMRTPDEHPLLVRDLESAHEWFDSVRAEPFNLLSLGAVPVRRTRIGPLVGSLLRRSDAWLFRHCAVARRWSWMAVIEVDRPRSLGAWRPE